MTIMLKGRAQLEAAGDGRESRPTPESPIAHAAAFITPRWTYQSKWIVELRMLFADQNAATTLKKHFKKHDDAVENGLLVLLNIIFFESRELLMGATHGQNKEVICPLPCSDTCRAPEAHQLA